jgi:alanyl-tRNA synthetase
MTTPTLTEKLYWADPFANDFEARIVGVAGDDERFAIVLDRTLFYPEAGGQLADAGTLVLEPAGSAGAPLVLRVHDVQIDGDGRIEHRLDPSACAVAGRAALLGLTVRGTIDRARRRDHMEQHTAQHMLSRALSDIAKAETVSSRLGATDCTIDLDTPELRDVDVLRAEDLVNDVIRSDVTVRSRFPSAGELAAMPLRRQPKVTENVRIIDVDGFDLSPCGGTHCTRTGQIGLVKVTGTERYKGMTRLHFGAGGRALEESRKKERALAELAREFTCGPLDVAAAVAKLRGDLKSKADALANARGELVELVAREQLALAERAARDGEAPFTVVFVERARDDVAALRALAGRLVARPDIVAVCAARDEDSGDVQLVVQRGASAAFDCGAWFKEASRTYGGRGGGRPDRAEGRLPGAAPLQAMVAALRDAGR